MAGFMDAVKKSFTGGDSYDQGARKLHFHLLNDLNHMTEDEQFTSALFSMDLKYNTGLQRQRLSSHGIRLKRVYHFDEQTSTAVSPLMGKDQRYVTRVPVALCRRENQYFSDAGLLKKDVSETAVCSYVVFAKDQDPRAAYCCPNCGDINSVAQLLEQGCRSCRTRFILPDLYPRITNFYTIRKKSYNRAKLFPFLLLGILAALVFFFLVSSKQVESGAPYYFTMIVTAFCGLVFGWLLYGIGMLVLLMIDAVSSGPKLSDFNQTRKKLPLFMQQYDPFFSVDFFVGKVNNLLKTLVFTEDYKNCSIYEKNDENPCRDILDIEYQGVIRLNHASSDSRFVCVDLDLYARTTSIQKNKLRQKDEIFRMQLCRAVGVQDDYNVSFHNIECRFCGASFNAVRERSCPYCHNPYLLRNYDWVVTDFERC